MRSSLRTLVLAATAALSLGFAGCTEKDEPEPGAVAAARGSISGRVIPAGSVSSIVVTNSLGHIDATVIPDPTTGAYSVGNLPVGTYQLVFAPVNSNYAAPPSRTGVFVTADQTADAGFVVVNPALPATYPPVTRGTMTWTVGTRNVTTTNTGLVFHPNGDVTFAGAVITGTTTSDIVTIRIPRPAVGSFALNDPAISHATYTPNNNTTTYNSYAPGVTTPSIPSVVNLTSYNVVRTPTGSATTGSTISGTFSFGVGLPLTGTGGPLNITNGTFNITL